MALKIETIAPETTALLVIDMQNDFVKKGAPLETPMALEMMDRLKGLIEHCRKAGIQIIYTRHVHRQDGSDMGLYSQIYPGLGEGKALIDEKEGSELYPEMQPREGEIVIKKHRYSAFFGTDLDIILRSKGIKDIAIAGATTEDCCLATARDAMYRDYRVAFLADATGTYDYPDIGYGAVSAEDLHKVILTVLGVTTAHVMNTDDFRKLIDNAS